MSKNKKKKQEDTAVQVAEPMKKITYRGYTVVQSPRTHHVMVGQGGRSVFLHRCDHALDRAGLQKVVDDYLTPSGQALKRGTRNG